MKSLMPAVLLTLGCVATGPVLNAQVVWPVDVKPVLDIRDLSAAGVVNFQLPVGATRLEGGSLLVGDRRAGAVRYFDAAGKLSSTFGRIGEGPGEFSGGLMSGARCGADSLLVWDRRARRAAMVSPSSGVSRQFKFATSARARGPEMHVRCTASGGLAYLGELTWDWSNSTGDRPLGVASGGVFLADRNGRAVASLDNAVVGSQWVPVVGPTGTRAQFLLPLGTASYLATVGEEIFVGVSDSPNLVVLRLVRSTDARAGSPEARLVPHRTINLPITKRRPTALEFKQAAEVIAGEASNQAFADTVLAQLLLVKVPDRMPAFFGLFSDSEGLVWIQTSPPGSAKTEFLVMHPNGSANARVSLPTSASIYEIGRDYILGGYTDRADETHVAVWRLDRKLSKSHQPDR